MEPLRGLYRVTGDTSTPAIVSRRVAIFFHVDILSDNLFRVLTPSQSEHSMFNDFLQLICNPTEKSNANGIEW